MSKFVVAAPAIGGTAQKRSPHCSRTRVGHELKKQIRNFWENSPCDSGFSKAPMGTPAFYRELDEHRYKSHRRLQSCIEFQRFAGSQILEIGCGCGSEGERFVRAGGHYTAFDLTYAALSITETRFRLAKLRGAHFVQGDAEDLPFASNRFDLVYSHGVLHHVPNTAKTILEIHRVLRPGGRAIVMLYHRNSFNYQVNLRLVRRVRSRMLTNSLGLTLARRIWHEPEEELRRHAELMKHEPDSHLDMQKLLNRNTDGPDNPLSQAFSKFSAGEMFRQFSKVEMEVMFWNPNWLPGIGRLLPRTVEDCLASVWGWHLWMFAQKHQLRFASDEAS